MDFKKLVEEARTCRRFEEQQPLQMADLEWLVDCARMVPSGANAQQLRFMLISQGPTCSELFTHTHWARALKDWKGPEEGERPTAFIAVLMPQKESSILCYDVGIACQTIQLAASSRGWGCCIILSFDAGPCQRLLEVPEGLKIALVLGLGVAKEKRCIAPMPADGSCNYWRDAANVHHVPKRSLAELVLKRF